MAERRDRGRPGGARKKLERKADAPVEAESVEGEILTGGVPSGGGGDVPVAGAAESKLEAFVDKNWKVILGVGGAALLLAAGVLFFRFQAEAREGRAAEELAASWGELDKLRRVASDFEGTAAAGTAAVAHARGVWEKGDTEEALKRLDSFLSGYPEHELVGEAKLQRAAWLQELGQVDTAMAAYLELVEQRPGDPVAPMAWVQYGDLLVEKGDLEAALEVYESMPVKFQAERNFGSYAALRDQRVSLLTSGLPLEAVEAPEQPAPSDSLLPEMLELPGLPDPDNPLPAGDPGLGLGVVPEEGGVGETPAGEAGEEDAEPVMEEGGSEEGSAEGEAGEAEAGAEEAGAAEGDAPAEEAGGAGAGEGATDPAESRTSETPETPETTDAPDAPEVPSEIAGGEEAGPDGAAGEEGSLEEGSVEEGEE